MVITDSQMIIQILFSFQKLYCSTSSYNKENQKVVQWSLPEADISIWRTFLYGGHFYMADFFIYIFFYKSDGAALWRFLLPQVLPSVLGISSLRLRAW